MNDALNAANARLFALRPHPQTYPDRPITTDSAEDDAPPDSIQRLMGGPYDSRLNPSVECKREDAQKGASTGWLKNISEFLANAPAAAISDDYTKVVEQDEERQVSLDAMLIIYPLLVIYAVRNKLARAWLAWKVARLMDAQGSGRVKRVTLHTQLRVLFNLSNRHVEREIKNAIGVFFNEGSNETWLYYNSVGRTAFRLGCYKVTSKPMTWRLRHVVTAKQIRQLAYVCALALWSSFNKPFSRANIQRIVGLTPRTQRTYDRELGGVSGRQFAFVELSAQEHCLHELSATFGHAVRSGPDDSVIKIQLPNCYEPEIKRLGRGKTAHARKQFKQAKLRDTPRTRPMATFELKPRRFFKSANEAIKVANRGQNTLSPITDQHVKHLLFRAYRPDLYRGGLTSGGI